MIIIGITGSIGTGKTTVSKMLKMLKIPIFDSDKKVKEILDENHLVKEKILKIWPDAISYNHMQRKIDKVALSNKIFNNKKERKKLENIIHPLVEKERNTFLHNFRNFGIVGLDIPLLRSQQIVLHYHPLQSERYPHHLYSYKIILSCVSYYEYSKLKLKTTLS